MGTGSSISSPVQRPPEVPLAASVFRRTTIITVLLFVGIRLVLFGGSGASMTSIALPQSADPTMMRDMAGNNGSYRKCLSFDEKKKGWTEGGKWS